jgi:hypothetical protein
MPICLDFSINFIGELSKIQRAWYGIKKRPLPAHLDLFGDVEAMEKV